MKILRCFNIINNKMSLVNLPLPIKFFMFGAGFSAIGNATFRISLFWYVSHILEHPAVTSLIGIMLFLPAFFMAPLAGWLSDKYTNARISSLFQLLACCLLLIIANIQNLDLSVYILLPIALIQSLLSIYSSSFNMAYCRNSLGDDEMKSVVKIMYVISSAAMVVGPMIVALPLKIETIEFESIFYFNALSYFLFGIILLTLPRLKVDKQQIGVFSNFFRTVRVIGSTVKIRNAFIAFLGTHFSYGGIAVALPIIVNHNFGDSAGTLYASLEVIGGGIALISSIFLRNIKAYNVLCITGLAALFYVINYFFLSEATLYLLIIFVFSFSILQVVKTNTLIFSETERGLAGSMNSLLIMGQSISAAFSSLVCYIVISLTVPKLCFIISACALLFVIISQHSVKQSEAIELKDKDLTT